MYVPREVRIDVVDISDKESMFKVSEIIVDAQDLYKTSNLNLLIKQDSLSLAGYYNLVYNELSNNTLDRTSSTPIYGSYTNQTQALLNTGDYFYSGGEYGRDNKSIVMHDVRGAFTLYETKRTATITEEDGICDARFELIETTLLSFDSFSCSREKKINVFSDANSDDFAYSKQITVPFDYIRATTVEEYVYFIGYEALTVAKFSDNDLEILATIEHSFSYGSAQHLSAIDYYENKLIIRDGNYLHMFDLTEPSQPKFISKQLDTPFGNESDFFQYEGEYLYSNIDFLGQVDFFSINYAPIEVDGNITINENSSTLNLLRFSDPENDELTITVIEEPLNGSYIIEQDVLVYTPNTNFSGQDSITVKVEDTNRNFIEQKVNIVINQVSKPEENKGSGGGFSYIMTLLLILLHCRRKHIIRV